MAKLRELARYLDEELYCARCDSFGHVRRASSGRRFCDVCWDSAIALPSSLRRLIMALLDADGT